MSSIEAASNMLVDFLTGVSPFSAENQAFWMAIQGAMMVRKGVNKEGKLHWFHAFILSVLVAFAGGMFGLIWMGKPAALLSNDLNMAGCIAAFIIVNYIPYDYGFKLMNTMPMSLVTVSWAQLFRCMGLIKFATTCFNEFKDSPSPYYPIPVFGPIIYATLLGNMGGLFAKGLEGHVQNGMPWPAQNGIFCASFYHFFAHDKSGPVGILLRSLFPEAVRFGLDDVTFAKVFVSLFMQVTGVLQMDRFYGPHFTPFAPEIISPWMDTSTWSLAKKESEYSARKQAIEKVKQQELKASKQKAS